jgi:hypothetical protein
MKVFLPSLRAKQPRCLKYQPVKERFVAENTPRNDDAGLFQHTAGGKNELPEKLY